MEDVEWLATERSDEAEELLLREYQYHMLRVQELKKFLHDSGIEVE